MCSGNNLFYGVMMNQLSIKLKLFFVGFGSGPAFGGSLSIGSSPAFGGAPSFGSPPRFGSSPAFGGTRTFGSPLAGSTGKDTM